MTLVLDWVGIVILGILALCAYSLGYMYGTNKERALQRERQTAKFVREVALKGQK